MTISGSGIPGTEVQITVGGTLADTVTIDDAGTFATTLQFTGAGLQYIGCQRVEAAGNIAEAQIPGYVIVLEPTATPTATATRPRWRSL